MGLCKGGAVAVFALNSFWAVGAMAQANCQAALPAFTAATRAGTAEALSTYLNEHAPCFEAPARARLAALGGAPAAAAATNTQPAPAQAPAQQQAAVAPVQPASPPQQATLAPQVAAVQPPSAADPSCVQYGNARSERWDQPLNFRVINRTNVTLSVAWINYEGQRQPSGVVAPGGVFGGGTFVTHPFEFTGPDGACVQIIMPQVGTYDYFVGQ